MAVKERDRRTGEETGEKITLFKTVFVFDRSQVSAIRGREQAPLEPPSEPLAGDSHAHLLAPLKAFAKSLGYSVSFEAIDGSAGGFCDPRTKRIVVEAALPANAQLRAVIHETAHALGVDYEHYSRAQAEVIVDTVTFVATASVGLAVGGESIPYVAGWGEHGALEAVTEFAATIDSIARRIEDVLAAGDDADQVVQSAAA